VNCSTSAATLGRRSGFSVRTVPSSSSTTTAVIDTAAQEKPLPKMIGNAERTFTFETAAFARRQTNFVPRTLDLRVPPEPNLAQPRPLTPHRPPHSPTPVPVLTISAASAQKQYTSKSNPPNRPRTGLLPITVNHV
jgi:hypothetical protein